MSVGSWKHASGCLTGQNRVFNRAFQSKRRTLNEIFFHPGGEQRWQYVSSSAPSGIFCDFYLQLKSVKIISFLEQLVSKSWKKRIKTFEGSLCACSPKVITGETVFSFPCSSVFVQCYKIHLHFNFTKQEWTNTDDRNFSRYDAEYFSVFKVKYNRKFSASQIKICISVASPLIFFVATQAYISFPPKYGHICSSFTGFKWNTRIRNYALVSTSHQSVPPCYLPRYFNVFINVILKQLKATYWRSQWIKCFITVIFSIVEWK